LISPTERYAAASASPTIGIVSPCNAIREPNGSPTGLDHLRIPFEGVALAA
jgi:hypothetical protein